MLSAKANFEGKKLNSLRGQQRLFLDFTPSLPPFPGISIHVIQCQDFFARPRAGGDMFSPAPSLPSSRDWILLLGGKRLDPPPPPVCFSSAFSLREKLLCTVVAARDGEKERDRNLFPSHGCSFSPFPPLSFPGRNHQIDSSMPSSPLTLSSLFHLPSIGDSPIPQCSSGFKEIFCIKRRFYTATFLSCF